MDKHTKAQRSYNMSRVKAKNTKPEMIMFGILQENGFRFEKHVDLVGKPDICFTQAKVLIFINGEFWHGKNFDLEKDSYSEFWLNKIRTNILRDNRNQRILRSRGWHVMNIWGRYITRNPDKAFARIVRLLNKHNGRHGH